MTPNQIVNFLKNEDESAPKTDSEDPPNIDPKSSVFEGWKRTHKTNRIETPAWKIIRLSLIVSIILLSNT